MVRPSLPLRGRGLGATSPGMDETLVAAVADAAPLPILIAPDPALRRKAAVIGPADQATVREAIPRLFAAMYAAPGIGLAAPQVGLSLRLFVIDLQTDGRREPMVVINPEILERSAEVETREEGCLSFPDQYADVTRPRAIRARWLDETGARHEGALEGLLARCFQHETDHLDGILFVDHISALKRNMIMRRLAKRQREKDARRA